MCLLIKFALLTGVFFNTNLSAQTVALDTKNVRPQAKAALVDSSKAVNPRVKAPPEAFNCISMKAGCGTVLGSAIGVILCSSLCYYSFIIPGENRGPAIQPAAASFAIVGGAIGSALFGVIGGFTGAALAESSAKRTIQNLPESEDKAPKKRDDENVPPAPLMSMAY